MLAASVARFGSGCALYAGTHTDTSIGAVT
jgi:hypothetical protein